MRVDYSQFLGGGGGGFVDNIEDCNRAHLRHAGKVEELGKELKRIDRVHVQLL